MVTPVPIPTDRIAAFCRKWRIRELSLFGSILRDDFRPDSDVDVLVVFDDDVSFDWDTWLAMESELRAIFGNRNIDLVERRLLKNPFRRDHILTNRRIIYAA